MTDELYMAASNYANKRSEEYQEACKKRGEKPHHNEKEYGWIWLAHHEGYSRGYLDRIKEEKK